MAKNLSIVANGISGDEGHLLGYNVSDNGIYTPAIGDVVRGTTATYVAQDGLLKTAPPNVARVDYTNGVAELLLEPSSTNLITYSEDFSSSYWEKGGVTVGGGYLAPDGSNNAYKVSGVIGSSYLKSIDNQVTQPSNSCTIWAKTTSGVGVVSLADILVSTFVVTEEWQRFEVKNTSTTGMYAVDFRSNQCTLSEVIIWGAQTESNHQSTSYIPTNGATATRSADSLTNFGSSPLIDGSRGIIFYEAKAFNNGTYNTISLNGNNVWSQIGIDLRFKWNNRR